MINGKGLVELKSNLHYTLPLSKDQNTFIFQEKTRQTKVTTVNVSRMSPKLVRT